MWESRNSLRGLLKNTLRRSQQTTQILKHKSQQKAMHHEEIELNFDASCQQILVLESENLWEGYQ
jgi:hypothetical protein